MSRLHKPSEEVMQGGWVAMTTGTTRRAEFESVVVDASGSVFLVEALVCAQILPPDMAAVARQAAAAGQSPLEAVRREEHVAQSDPSLEANSMIGPGEELRRLAATALANGPPK